MQREFTIKENIEPEKAEGLQGAMHRSDALSRG
jgi:hypothetical protein